MDTMLVIKDKDGKPVDDRFGFGGKWDGSPDFSLYYPMTVRFTAVVVAKGAAYNPGAVHWRMGDLHWKDVKELRGVIPAWQRGQVGSVLAAAEKEEDPTKAEEARKIAEGVKAWAAKRRKEIEDRKLSLPDWAPGALARLGALLSPAPLGKEYLAESKEWEKDPVVQASRKAKALWDSVRDALRKVKGKGKASDPAFAAQFAAELRRIAQVAGRLRKEFPDTPAAMDALAAAGALGLSLPE